MADLYKSKRQKDMTESIDKMDEAIDNLDMDLFEMELAKLEELNPIEIEEDTLEFSNRIIQLVKKGENKVRPKKRNLIALVAMLIFTLSLGATIAFGSGMLNLNFYEDDKTISIKTSENMSEDEVKALVEDASKSYDEGVEEDANILIPEERTYETIEDLEADMNVTLYLPKYIPSEFSLSKKVKVMTRSIEDTIYINYENEIQDVHLGVTTMINRIDEGAMITVTDAVYNSKYKSKAGIEFTVLDEDGGKIFMIERGNITYAVVMMGIEKKEALKIIDSMDFEK